MEAFLLDVQHLKRTWRAWRYQFQSHFPYKICNGATSRSLLHDLVECSFAALSIQIPVNSFSNVLLQAHLLRHSQLRCQVCHPNCK